MSAIDQYVQKVNKQLGNRQEGARQHGIRQPTEVQLTCYAMWMLFVQPLADKEPSGFFPAGYMNERLEAAFVRAELEFLTTLGFDNAERAALEPIISDVLQKCAGDHVELFMRFRGISKEWIPQWFMCTSISDALPLPVYEYAVRKGQPWSGVFLVNEALTFPRDARLANHNVPLREILHGTWRSFEKFPAPYQRDNGTIVRGASEQSPSGDVAKKR